ncbi:MAG: hypothetical protein WAM97_22160 [Acidimicrobiales bacterium]
MGVVLAEGWMVVVETTAFEGLDVVDVVEDADVGSVEVGPNARIGRIRYEPPGDWALDEQFSKRVVSRTQVSTSIADELSMSIDDAKDPLVGK